MARRQTAGASLRLIVELDGKGGARLTSVAQVNGQAPPSLSLEPIELGTRSGFWFEVQDTNGHTLYRRVTEDPRRTSTEVFTGDADSPLARAVIGPRPELFAPLIPDLAEGVYLEFFGSGLGAEEQAAVSLWRLDLRGSLEEKAR